MHVGILIKVMGPTGWTGARREADFPDLSGPTGTTGLADWPEQLVPVHV